MAYFLCNGAQFRGYIDVYGVANATVTATTGSKSFSAVANAGGYARISVKTKGTYTITSTGTTHVGHATVTTYNPVTAVYYWNKYNANYRYYEVNNGLRTGRWRPLWGRDEGPQSAYHGMNTTDVLDPNTGIYTISGGTTEYISHRWGLYSSRMAYNCTNQDNHIARDVSGGNNICANRLYENGECSIDILSTATAVYDMTSAGTWAQGTLIGSVESSNLNAHHYGYNSDGYWYVAT